jgi:hypothetical protein
MLMAVAHRRHHLICVASRILLRKIPVLYNSVKQLAAEVQLRNYMELAIVLNYFIQLEHVGVVQLLDGIELVEHLAGVFGRYCRFIDTLNCPLLPRQYMLTKRYKTAGAFTYMI